MNTESVERVQWSGSRDVSRRLNLQFPRAFFIAVSCFSLNAMCLVALADDPPQFSITNGPTLQLHTGDPTQADVSWDVSPADSSNHAHTVTWAGGAAVGTEDENGHVIATLTGLAYDTTFWLTIQSSAGEQLAVLDNGGGGYPLTTPPPPGGWLQFSSATYTAGEASGTATITVTRTGGTSGTVTVNYGIGGESWSGTLTFGDGESSKTFDVSIYDDAVYTGDTTINFHLCMPQGGAALGAQSSTTLTIAENDPQPDTLQFSAASYTVSEADGTATITVTRTGSNGGTVTVDWSTSYGSGYSGTLTFTSSDTSKTFDIPISTATTASLTLSNPQGRAVLGAQSNVMLTITAADPPPSPSLTIDGPVSITYQTSGDYQYNTVTVTWHVSQTVSGGTLTHYVLAHGSSGDATVGSGSDDGNGNASVQFTISAGSVYQLWVDSINTSLSLEVTNNNGGNYYTVSGPALIALDDLRVDAVGCSSATVSWALYSYWAGSATNSAACSDESGTHTASCNFDSSSGRVTAIFSDLIFGHAYTFTAASDLGSDPTNQGGATLVSTGGSFTTLTPTIAVDAIGVDTNSLTPISATVLWSVTNTTSQTATHTVFYWLHGSDGILNPLSASAASDPGNGPVSVALAGLQAGQSYDYYVQSSNNVASAAGPAGSPGFAQFQTLPPYLRITSPPTRGAVDTNSQSAALSWGIENWFDQSVNNTVSYTWSGPTGSGSGTAYSVTEPGQSIASVTISNLVAGATYTFNANSTVAGMGADSFSTQSSGGTFTITTNELPLPSPLVIFNVSANPDLLTDTMALVTWNVAYASTNDYGMASHFVLVSSNAPPTALEQMVFAQGQEDEAGNVWAVLSGLSPAQTNYFSVESVLDSSSGRFAVDNNGGLYYSFTNTVSGDVPTDPLAETIAIIQPPIVSFVSDTMAIISWQVTPTDWAYPSHFVIYGTNNPPTLQDALIAPAYQADANNVAAVLAPLQPGCNYWFSVQSVIDFTEGRFATDNGYGLYYPFTTLSTGGQPVHGDYSSLHDGIPDWWKLQYGFGIFDPYVADDDPDGDGFSNLEEYIDGTNPLDPLSHRLVIPPLPPVIVSFTKDRFDDFTPAASVTVELERDNTERAVSVNMYYMDSDPSVFCSGVTFQPGQQKASVVVSPRVSTGDGGAFSTLMLTATEASPEVQFARSMAFVEIVAPRYWVNGATYSDPNATTAWVTVARNETNDTYTVDVLYAAEETTTAATASFSPGDSLVWVPIILRSDLMVSSDPPYLTIKLAPPWESSADIVYVPPPQTLPAPYVELRVTSEKVDGPDYYGSPRYFIVRPGNVVLEAKVFDYDQDNQPIEVTDYAQFYWGSCDSADGPTITTNIVESTSVGVTARNWRASAPFQFAPLAASDEAGAGLRLEVPKVSLDMAGVTNKVHEGGFVPVNADNDNGSVVRYYIPEVRDFEATSLSFDDEDLKQLLLSGYPPKGPGILTLSCSAGHDKIKVWTSLRKLENTAINLPKSWTLSETNRPPTLYIEGIRPSASLRDIELRLDYNAGNISSTDALKISATPVLSNLTVATTPATTIVYDNYNIFTHYNTGPAVKLKASVFDIGNPEGNLEIIQNAQITGLLANGAAAINARGDRTLMNVAPENRGKWLVDVLRDRRQPLQTLWSPFYPNYDASEIAVESNDSPRLDLNFGSVIPWTGDTSIGIYYSFRDYAVWKYPRTSISPETVYFLGDTYWDLIIQGEYQRINDTLQFDKGPCSGVFADHGFSLSNADDGNTAPPSVYGFDGQQLTWRFK